MSLVPQNTDTATKPTTSEVKASRSPRAAEQRGDREGASQELGRAPRAESPDAVNAEHYQSVFGNAELLGALADTQEQGVSAVMRADLAMGTMGVPSEGFGRPEASNQASLAVMRRAKAGQGGAAGGQEAVARVLKRSGEPLPAALRGRLEGAFGRDLSGVRIHTDSEAARAAESVNAVAFAAGTHVVFGRGAWAPGTPRGEEILGHELTHVVQHLEGRAGAGSDEVGGVAVTTPGDAVEREADAMGQALAKAGGEALTEPLLESPVQEPAPLDVGAVESSVESAASVQQPGAGEAVARQASGEEIDQQRERAAQRAREVSEQIAEQVGEASEEDQADQEAQGGHQTTAPPEQDGTAPEESADEQLEAQEQPLTPEQEAIVADIQAAEVQEGEVEDEGNGPVEEAPVEEQQAQAEGEEETPQGEEDAAQANAEENAPETGGAGGGAGGGGSAAGSGGGGGGTPALDQFVDHYMETHWDRSDYDAAVQQFDVQTQIGGVVDRVLPPETSPEVRSALNMAYSIQTGVMDAVLMGMAKAVPGVGSIFHILDGVKSVWGAVNDYGEAGVDNPVAMWANIIRGVVDTVGSVLGNIGDLATVVQDIAALFAWTGVGAAIAGIVATCGTIADAIGAALDTVKLACSTVSLISNVMAAQDAEANEEFRRAGKLRELARGDAINVVVDGIAVLCNVIGAATANVVPTEMGEDAAEAVGQVTKNSTRTLDDFMNAKAMTVLTGIKENQTGSQEALSAGGRLFELSGGGGMLRATQAYNNVAYHIGLGDAMAYSPDGLFGGRYIQPEALTASGEAGGLLSQARQTSIQHFEQVHEDLDSAGNPKWTQKIVNDTANPPDRSWYDFYSDLLKPSKWMEAAFLTGVGAANGALDLLGGGGEAALDGLAGALQNVADPLFEWIQTQIDEYKPALDQLLLELADTVGKQRDILAGLREGLAKVQEFMDAIDTIADQGGVVESFMSDVVGRIESMKTDASALGIPDWVPEFTYRALLSRYNSTVQGIADGVQGAVDNTLPKIDAFVEAQTEYARGHLERLNQAISEGGEVEALVQGAYDSLTQTMAQFLTAIAEWDPDVRPDFSAAIDWLRGAADRAHQVSPSNRMDQFKEHVQSVGQPAVDDWKAQHSETVKEAYSPEVPAAEVEAAGQAYQLILAQIDAIPAEEARRAQSYRVRAQAAYAICTSNAGGKGQAAIEGFWDGANALAQLAGEVGA